VGFFGTSALPLCLSGKAHRKTPRKATLSFVLGPHAPSEWRGRRPPAGACPTRFSHYTAPTALARI